MATDQNRIRIPSKVSKTIIQHLQARDAFNEKAKAEDAFVSDLVKTTRTLMGLNDSFTPTGEDDVIYFVKQAPPVSLPQSAPVNVVNVAPPAGSDPEIVAAQAALDARRAPLPEDEINAMLSSYPDVGGGIEEDEAVGDVPAGVTGHSYEEEVGNMPARMAAPRRAYMMPEKAEPPMSAEYVEPVSDAALAAAVQAIASAPGTANDPG